MVKWVGVIVGVGLMACIAFFLFAPADSSRSRDNKKIAEMLQAETYLEHILPGAYYGHFGFAYNEQAIVQVFIENKRIYKIELISERTSYEPAKGQTVIEQVIANQSLKIEFSKEHPAYSYQQAVYKAIIHAIRHAHYNNLERQWIALPRLPSTGV